jgi:hypothetical protein
MKLSVITTIFQMTEREYADSKREAAYNDICPTDLIFTQQLKINKLSIRFNPIPVAVTACHVQSEN